jgi:hypothetical protein
MFEVQARHVGNPQDTRTWLFHCPPLAVAGQCNNIKDVARVIGCRSSEQMPESIYAFASPEYSVVYSA